MDFLPVEIVDGRLTSELGPLDKDSLTADHHSSGERPVLEIMVRPDCIECLPDAGGDGVILDREFRGAFYQYRVRLPSGNKVSCLMSHIAEMPVGAPVSVRLRDGHRARLFADGRLVEASGVCD